MLKLSVVILCLALLGLTMADQVPLDNEKIINSRAVDIAKWATVRLSKHANANDLKFVKVSNVKTSLLQDKIQFDLAVDVAIVQDNSAALKTCHLSVLDSPWTNTRVLDESSINCVASATF